jgi:eukaryotic-like serine/threonine-protein kinase
MAETPMTPGRWHQVQELYHRALELIESDRDGFLREGCAGDNALRREVESLLANRRQDDSFFEQIGVEQAAYMLVENSSRTWIGRQIGPYQVLSLAGAGAMGEVYRGRDTRLKRDVAIKVLPSRLALDADHLDRLRHEAQLLASLNHPNVAAIYGLEECDGVPCAVMEMVLGETLAERLQRGPLSVSEAVPIAIQITEAVEAAHDKGIIHRDLKPANIKLTPEGKVKVLDFGVAKAFIGADSQTAIATAASTVEGVIVGTPTYMSPEQARGQATDRRTDIWAFGCAFFTRC